MELNHGIQSYFVHVSSELISPLNEGKLKIEVDEDEKKKTKIINHKRTRTAKDGEYWHGLQARRLRNCDLTFA